MAEDMRSSKKGRLDKAATLPPSRRREILTFFALAFGIWPFLAVCAVGGYGFLVWMYQIIAGPPGPLGH